MITGTVRDLRKTLRANKGKSVIVAFLPNVWVRTTRTGMLRDTAAPSAQGDKVAFHVTTTAVHVYRKAE